MEHVRLLYTTDTTYYHYKILPIQKASAVESIQRRRGSFGYAHCEVQCYLLLLPNLHEMHGVQGSIRNSAIDCFAAILQV